MKKEPALRLFENTIVNLYLQTEQTVPALSRQFGVPATTIYLWLHQRGIRGKERQAQRENSLRGEIKRLYIEDKLPCFEIAQRLGMPTTNVTRRVRLMGIGRSRKEIFEILKQKGWTNPAMKADDATVARLFLEDKLTPSRIASKLGYAKGSGTNILNRLRKLGLIEKPEISYDEYKDLNIQYQRYEGGYIKIRKPDHPRRDKNGFIWEHILVWEEYHQKRLPKGYCIHHLNGIKSDNRPENLVAMKAGEHIHQTEPFKKKIRQLEIENRQLRRALEGGQSIFYISEN